MNIEINNQFYGNVLPVGAKVKFSDQKQRYIIRASNVAFAVCTKPLNMIRRLGRGKYRHDKTVIYTVIDWYCKVRGTENLIFGMGAESDEDCKEMLERLTSGDSEVSYRNRVDLDIESVILPPRPLRKKKK